MNGKKPGDRGMVRGRHALQKIHEIDIPAAGRLDIPAGIDAVHRRVENDLQKSPPVSPDFFGFSGKYHKVPKDPSPPQMHSEGGPDRQPGSFSPTQAEVLIDNLQKAKYNRSVEL